MNTKDYSIQVEKFLKHFQARNAQREKNGYDANTVLDLALKDYRDSIWSRTIPVYALFFSMLVLLFLSRNSILQLSLTLVFILTSIASLFKWGYKWIPRIDYLPQIRRRINEFNSNLKRNEIVNSEMISEYLFSNESINDFKAKELIKKYFEIKKINWVEVKDYELNQVLLSLFYILNKTLNYEKDDDEIGYLLGSLVSGSDYKIKTERLSVLNRYNRIKNGLKKETYEKMITDLDEAKIILENAIKKIDEDIKEIENHKNNFQN